MNYTAKLNLVKIDKDRLFKSEKGNIYLDVVIIETQNNQYGDSHMIVQSVSKEEREKGVKGEILGNMKPLQSQATESQEVKEGDLPF